MASYQINLLSKRTVAEGTMAFEFEKPADFTFEAGQYGHWTLIDPTETDAEGNGRDFSIASAPADANLLIASRIRDTAFKRALSAAEPGLKIKLEGPMGSLTMPAFSTKPVVFLAGGIGITPFRSMVRQAATTKLSNQITLFYSNRRPEDSAFIDELIGLTKENLNFKLVASMTEMEKSTQPWDGERGFIDAAMLHRHLTDLTTPTFFTAGPPGMVAAMKKLLTEVGVPDEQVRSEDFVGY